MGSIPSNLSRVPNSLAYSLSLGYMSRTNLDLLRVQQQIATGVEISRPSDDIVRAATISILDERLDRTAQLQRNLSHADAALGVLDTIFGEANTLAQRAKSIASDQLNSTYSSSDRAGQAAVVDEILRSLFDTSNRQSVAGYALGGTRTDAAPIVAHYSGYRFVGTTDGLTTDLGAISSLPITFGAGNPITSLSTRVRGSVDYSPALTADTRLADLGGARSLGIASGPVQFAFGAGPSVQVDLTGADTVQDIVTRLESAIQQYEADQGVTILDTGGVSLSGESITIDVVSGGTLTFTDIGTATTARDLGLASDTPFSFTDTSPAGAALAPRLTFRTPVAALAGVSGALGRIQIANAGRSAEVDLSGSTTLGDIRNAIESANLGVRVVINEAGTGIDIRNELSAGRAGSLSISEVPGQNLTATRLGIRSFSADTRVSDLNFGRGVGIVDGQNDPITNAPTVELNSDFRITLGDSAGTIIDVDLRPQDMATVQSVLDRINAEAATQLAAAGLPPTAFVAELRDGANGIVLRQDATFTAPFKIDARNNSPAAAHLGLMNRTYDASSASLIGEDRAKVRVDSLFSDLIDLREALLANDVSGISLAGQHLDRSIAGLVDARGLVGGYAQRVEQTKLRETDRATIDETVRSELRDTDYAKAASRFSLLQTQLQAAMQVTAAAQGRSLLDFLG